MVPVQPLHQPGACIVMAYIVMAYIATAYTIMAALKWPRSTDTPASPGNCMPCCMTGCNGVLG